MMQPHHEEFPREEGDKEDKERAQILIERNTVSLDLTKA